MPAEDDPRTGEHYGTMEPKRTAGFPTSRRRSTRHHAILSLINALCKDASQLFYYTTAMGCKQLSGCDRWPHIGDYIKDLDFVQKQTQGRKLHNMTGIQSSSG